MSGVLGGLIAAFPTPITSSFESIATVTAAGGESSLTFNSIPSTYKHLQIRALVRASTGSPILQMTYNNITTGIYTSHTLYGTGSTVTASRLLSQTNIGNVALILGTVANNYGVVIIDVHDYANTSKYKTTRIFSGQDTNGATVSRVMLTSGLYPQTTAISSIQFFSAAPFGAGSTFALYGIKG